MGIDAIRAELQSFLAMAPNTTMDIKTLAASGGTVLTERDRQLVRSTVTPSVLNAWASSTLILKVGSRVGVIITTWPTFVEQIKAATAARELTFGEDVPSSVELRWRSGEHQAALTWSLCTTGPTGSAVSRSSAARSDGRCRWPLTRRNCLPASIIPAAHQRSAICPSRQRLTLAACSRQTEIIDSMRWSSAACGRGWAARPTAAP